MYDEATVEALVVAARAGDGEAWSQIVERYAPLVWSICRRHRLSRTDIDDVGQFVWLKLFEHLSRIREPAALPGWLARTTRNECLRLVRAAGQGGRIDTDIMVDEVAVDGGYELVDEELERAQQHLALRQAFSQLRPQCQKLLSMLFRDARPPYSDIGEELGMKVGSIGPTRERCLRELRRCPALAALIASYRHQEDGGEVRAAQPVVD